MKKTLVSVLSAGFLCGFVIGCQPSGGGASGSEHTTSSGSTHSAVHSSTGSMEGVTTKTGDTTHR